VFLYLQIKNIIQKTVNAKLDPKEAQKLVTEVGEQPGAFVRHILDGQGCLRSIFWATPEQVQEYRLHGDVIIQDNTCKTLKANRPFFAVVTVDGESRWGSCGKDV
jgi:hypothetical protein